MSLFSRFWAWFAAPFKDEPVRRKRIAAKKSAPVAEPEQPADPTAPWERGRDAHSLDAREVRRHVLDTLHRLEVEARSFDDRALLRRLQAVVAMENLGLPPFPGTVVELKRMLSRGVEVPSFRLANIVEKDHALVEEVLRQARGPSWARGPESLHAAVTRIGNEALWRISMRFALEATVFYVPGYQEDVERIRVHSLVTAEVVAWMLGDAEERGGAWLAGLLHDVGKLIVLREAGALGAPVSRALLDEVMALTHASIGLLVARAWGFEELECGAIATHHGENRRAGPEARLGYYLHLADIAAHGVEARHARKASPARNVLVREAKGLGFDGDQALTVADRAYTRLKALRAA